MVERVYCILNDIKELPKCVNCNNNVKFKDMKNGYREFCSKSCGATKNENDIKESVIYAIINKNTEKYYIGHTTNLQNRINWHTNKLNKKEHKNDKLQNDYHNFNGTFDELFEVIVLETFTGNFQERVKKEQEWFEIQFDGNWDNIYNEISPDQTTHSPKYSSKITEKRPMTDEYREKLSKVNKGQDTSKAVAASIEARKGKSLNDDHKKNISNGMTEYHKEKRLNDENYKINEEKKRQKELFKKSHNEIVLEIRTLFTSLPDSLNRNDIAAFKKYICNKYFESITLADINNIIANRTYKNLQPKEVIKLQSLTPELQKILDDNRYKFDKGCSEEQRRKISEANKGNKPINAKISDEDVRRIRDEFDAFEKTGKKGKMKLIEKWAEEFSTTTTTISNVVKRRTYKNVK